MNETKNRRNEVKNLINDQKSLTLTPPSNKRKFDDLQRSVFFFEIKKNKSLKILNKKKQYTNIKRRKNLESYPVEAPNKI